MFLFSLIAAIKSLPYLLSIPVLNATHNFLCLEDAGRYKVVALPLTDINHTGDTSEKPYVKKILLQNNFTL